MDPAVQQYSKQLYEKLKKSALSKSCSKGVFVFMEGDNYLGPWILHKGSIVLVKSSARGKEQITRHIEPGEVFAEVPIYRGIDWYPLNARCSEASELSLLPTDAVRSALKKNSELAWLAACALASRVTEFRDFIFDLTLAEAKQRLIRYLLRKLKNGQNPSLGVVRLGVNHQDLALLLGIRPESLSRALAELEKAKKIKRLSRQTFQVFHAQLSKDDGEL